MPFTAGQAGHLAEHNALPVVIRGAGIDSTGVADSTTALQAVLNTATVGSPKAFFLPTGTYKLTTALSFPFAPNSSLTGAGRDLTTLSQTTAGQSVLLFQTADTHTILLRDFALSYPTEQSNTASIAILLGQGGGSANGFYYHHWRNLIIRNAYTGMALLDTSGQQTIWGCSFDNIRFVNIRNNAISLSPAVAIGMPINTFRSIAVNNTGASSPNTGSCIKLNAVEAIFDGVDIEGWYNEAFNIIGGSYVYVRGLHLEHHKFSIDFSRAIYLANGPMVVDGFSVAGDTTAGNTDAVFIARTDAGANLTLLNGTHNVTTTLGTSYLREVVYVGTTAGVSITVTNVTKAGGGLAQQGESSTNTHLYLTGMGMLPNGLRGYQLGSGVLTFGAGTPEAVVTARIGSLFLRSDGGAGTTLYVKQSGTGNTGWVAK